MSFVPFYRTTKTKTMKENIIIKQKYYPSIEIDNSESDIIQLWMNGKEDVNVIHIERENILLLIEQLKLSI